VGRASPLHEVALLRIVAQRLVGPQSSDPAAAVRWLTAVQAQDYRGALTSVALRTQGGSSTGVEAALSAGDVVRSWPMRGTLHLVAAEDLGWLLGLTASRQLAGAARRRAQLGLEDADLARAGDLAEDALRGGGRLRRAELMALWERGGVSTAGQRGYHLLWHLAQAGRLCLGPVGDGEQLVVLVSDWVRRCRELDREAALGELASRYFSSHGPATAADLARWTGLPAADARVGLAVARPGLESMQVDGVEHLLDPRTPQLLEGCRRQARGVFLLPGFDELLLGYGDRSAVLSTEHADRIVPGGNGMFRPTVLSDGRVVGTWRTVGRGARRTVEATPFTTFSAKVAAAVPRLHAALP
jgi:Winged helix DNA-binding domain